jgi:hypothetical protein
MVPKTLRYFENGPCVDSSISSADSPWLNYPPDGIPIYHQIVARNWAMPIGFKPWNGMAHKAHLRFHVGKWSTK